MKKYISTALTLCFATFLTSCASSKQSIEQYGTMHEAIGQNKSQGRVSLKKLVDKENYIGIGAIEHLNGEITIFDGEAIITEVEKSGKLKSMNGDVQTKKATMFVGAQVQEWIQVEAPKSMNKVEFEQWIAKEATLKGLKIDKAFMFKAKGKLTNARMHVMNGACPLHARMNKIVLPKNERPYEGKYKTIDAMVVGVYATDAVGKLTHPDTRIHPHIVYSDRKGVQRTGHLEDFGISSGTILYLPKM
jgi:alpha-acetolactate decarboxylase